MVNSAAEVCAGMPPSPEAKARQQAQAAIVKLRRLLPQIAAGTRYAMANPSLLGGPRTPEEWATHRKHYAKQYFAEELMMKALVDVHQPLPPGLPFNPKHRSRWHLPAAGLFLAYKNVVGSGSKSKHGPAARFIQLALKRAGGRPITLEAIEPALSRHPVTANR